MPIYAYRCEHCGHAQDVLQKVSDPRLTVCPACGQATYRKQVTAAGFQLKGSGWYVTDFRDSGKKPAGKTGADQPADGATQGADGQAQATNGAAAKPDAAAPNGQSGARTDPAGASGSAESASSSTPPPAPPAAP